ncbi:LytR/AlgR family response regulator transcription factor [Rudanella lutea]|uniref:LytR/AlgR family response regulator transcription factor n=1 Tax=Rudanella lutea TaxID=451374 RepID=UPI00038175AF|nr:LytTR family DNA-binding domain-containing protein [Rudanella lutea]
MTPLRILIVDNDPIDVIKLKVCIEELGHTWLAATDTVGQARDLILQEKPDLVICDLITNVDEGCMEVMELLETLMIPVLFATRYPQDKLYEKLTQRPMMGYMVKPVHRLSLRSYMELVYPNTRKLLEEQALRDRRFLLLRDLQNKAVKVSLSTIKWVSTQGNYCDIYTTEQRFVRKISLNKLLPELDERFVRVHYSYAVNMDFIDALDANMLYVGETAIPIGRSYKKGLMQLLHTRQREPNTSAVGGA